MWFINAGWRIVMADRKISIAYRVLREEQRRAYSQEKKNKIQKPKYIITAFNVGLKKKTKMKYKNQNKFVFGIALRKRKKIN